MTLLEQCLALFRWKRMILLNTILVAVAAVIIALLLPKWYRSVASVFPPEEEPVTASSLTGLVSAARMSAGRSTLPILASPSDLFAAVLESRTVREEIVRRFDLVAVYKVKTVDEALETLGLKVKLKVGTEGVVQVRVLDKSPQRAAEMANAFVELLDRVNREKRHVSARQARTFIEGRLEQNRRELAAAEDSLRRLQERTGALVPDEQIKAMIGAASEVQVQLLLREVDLAVLRAQVGPEHPDLRALQREVTALRARMEQLESNAAAGDGNAGTTGALDLPLGSFPGLIVDYLRALREVKVQEAVYEFLTEQYEQFRIQESRDTPTVQVLDQAVPAQRKARPIRWLICVSATSAAFLGSIVLAAFLEMIARARRDDPPRYAHWRAFFSEIGLGRALDRL